MDLGDLSDIFAKAKPNALPLDVTAQQQALARRQKVADMLTGLAFQSSPTQMVGQVAVAQSPLEAIAKTFAGGLAGYKQKGIDDSMSQIAGDYQNRQREAIADALSRPSEQERATALLMRPDLPELYAQGSKMQKSLSERKTKLSEEAIKGQSNVGKQMSAMAGDAAAGAGNTLMDKGEQYDMGKFTIDPATGKPMEALRGVARQYTAPNGTIFNANTQTGYLDAADKAPKMGVNVSQVGPKAGMQEYFKGEAEALNKERVALQESKAAMGTLDAMEKLDNAGMFNGFGANQIGATVKLGQQLGLNFDPNKLANMEGYRAAQTELWQKLISKMGGNRGVTKEEAEEIKQILPQVSDSPQGRARIVQIIRGAHQRSAQQHLQLSKMFGQAIKSEDPSAYIEARAQFAADPNVGATAVPQAQAPAGAPGGPKIIPWKQAPNLFGR